MRTRNVNIAYMSIKWCFQNLPSGEWQMTTITKYGIQRWRCESKLSLYHTLYTIINDYFSDDTDRTPAGNPEH